MQCELGLRPSSFHRQLKDTVAMATHSARLRLDGIRWTVHFRIFFRLGEEKVRVFYCALLISMKGFLSRQHLHNVFIYFIPIKLVFHWTKKESFLCLFLLNISMQLKKSSKLTAKGIQPAELQTDAIHQVSLPGGTPLVVIQSTRCPY